MGKRSDGEPHGDDRLARSRSTAAGSPDQLGNSTLNRDLTVA